MNPNDLPNAATAASAHSAEDSVIHYAESSGALTAAAPKRHRSADPVERAIDDLVERVMDDRRPPRHCKTRPEFVADLMDRLDAEDIACLIFSPDCDHAEKVRKWFGDDTRAAVAEYFQTSPRGQDLVDEALQDEDEDRAYLRSTGGRW